MSNPFSGIIDATLIELYNQGETELWRGLGVDCQLIFSPIKIACSECLPNVIGGLPGNFNQFGMPIPVFAGGVCPSCGGVGYRESSPTETIKMQINTDPKSFLAIFKPLMIESPGSFVETKLRLEDSPKVKKCVEAILHTAIAGYLEFRCSRASELVFSGLFKNKFVHLLWKRNG